MRASPVVPGGARSGRAARVAGRRRLAPASVGIATASRSWSLARAPAACSRERACAQAANRRPGIRGRRPSQGAMRIRARVAPAAVRLRSARYGPGCDSACAISDPEPSLGPIVRSGNGRLRGFCGSETWIARGTTSSTAVLRSRHHVIYGGAARRSCGPWAIGTSFGTLRTSVARSRSFSRASLATKVADLQVFPMMARPGLEPGTPRFSGKPDWTRAPEKPCK
jgi:hypothetical protein